MTEPTQITREQLALAHHRWHCAHEVDPEPCEADDQDRDFADFALSQAREATT